MRNFHGELAVKFTIQIASRYTVPELIRLAQLAHSEGFSQIWINDNLCQRNIFIVLAAMAARVPMKLGTSILVPYFRNPVDVADTIAALSELTEGRELSIGIARGDMSRAGQQIEMRKPIAMVRETTVAIKALLAGEVVSFRDFPVLAAYHHIRPEQAFRLSFQPAAPVRFYCGGNGPKMMRVAGEIMNGTLIGNYYIPLVRSGRLDSLLAIARAVAESTQPDKALFNIAELDLSISRDRRRALDFAKPYVAHVLMVLERLNFTHDEYRAIGMDPKLVQSLKEALASGRTLHDVSPLIPDHAVSSCFVAGDPEECQHQLTALMKEAERLQFRQIAFAKLGPDYDEAITLLRHQVLSV